MQRNRRRTRRKQKPYSRFVVYPKNTRVEVVESAFWQDGFTGVVVDNDIIHENVCHECSNREVCHSVAGLRLPTPSPRQVLVRSDQAPTPSLSGEAGAWATSREQRC